MIMDNGMTKTASFALLMMAFLTTAQAFGATWLNDDNTMILNGNELGNYCIYPQNTGDSDKNITFEVLSNSDYILNYAGMEKDVHLPSSTVSDDKQYCFNVKLPTNHVEGEKATVVYRFNENAVDNNGFVSVGTLSRGAFHVWDGVTVNSGDNNVGDTTSSSGGGSSSSGSSSSGSSGGSSSSSSGSAALTTTNDVSTVSNDTQIVTVDTVPNDNEVNNTVVITETESGGFRWSFVFVPMIIALIGAGVWYGSEYI